MDGKPLTNVIKVEKFRKALNLVIWMYINLFLNGPPKRCVVAVERVIGKVTKHF